ncbi:MAG TPA: ParB N-terminal domain-containing protein, partial [Gemmataceae bacterium]|nr:ParB N-terminal domain-containing protein [Gemmataceae bacterium]
MQQPVRKAEYDQLVQDVAASFRTGSTPGPWRVLQDLRYGIDDPLKERARALAGRAGEEDYQKERAFLETLTADALKFLTAGGHCESRTKGGQEQYRVTRALPAARAAGRRAANEGPPDTSSESSEPPQAGPDVPTAREAAPAPPPAAPGAPAGTTSSQVITRISVKDLEPHPRARLIPRMSQKQWKPFLAHVREHGVREPILVTPGGVVIDGRSRAEAAREGGYLTVPAVVVDWGEARQETHMLESALRRRHLTDDQLAMVEERLRKCQEPGMRRARARKAGRAGGRGRPKKNDSSGGAVSPELSPPAAGGEGVADPPPAPEKPGAVPERKRRAARAVDKASPEMGDRVQAGEVSLIEAVRALREQGKLPAAKAPKFGGAGGAA